MTNYYDCFPLDFLTQVSTKTGIILDTTFTLKTVICMLHEMESNPERFRGQRILFMHTGIAMYV